MIEYNKDTFIDLSKGKIVVAFYARWCGTCRQVSKSFALLEKNYDATFLRVDTEHEKDLTAKYSIQGIPTVIVLSNGVEIARISESMNVEEFQTFLDSVL